MATLPPVDIAQEPERGADSPTVKCENPACKRKGKSHMMINFMVGIGSPGHPDLQGWQCPGSGQIENRPEHWACSLECWKIVAHACIDEHMHETLKQAHASIGR